MTKTFREMIDGKPSVAIRAMTRGLREMSTWENWQVRMSVFFSVEESFAKEVCCACAATAAIMDLGKVRFGPDCKLKIQRAGVLGVDQFDFDWFEDCVDSLRRGFPDDLFEYCRTEYVPPNHELPCLGSCDWEENLPSFEAYAEKLEAQGL